MWFLLLSRLLVFWLGGYVCWLRKEGTDHSFRLSGSDCRALVSVLSATIIGMMLIVN